MLKATYLSVGDTGTEPAFVSPNSPPQPHVSVSQ